jgi:hypothetical protein
MPTKNPDIYVEEHNLIIAPDGVQTSQRRWPLDWGAIWVGAMAAVAAALLIGLIGIAVGAHHVGTRPARLSDLTLAGLVFSVIGAFFSFVLGGWAAGGIAGTRRADHASLQGAAVWLVALPMLVILAALGAGGFFGAWIGGLAGTPVWAASSGVTPDPDAALAARNSALGAVTALLIGLMGGVIGGWLASGEPMTFADRREPHMQPQEG